MVTNVTNSVLNNNFLSPVGYKFTLARTPNLNYNIQRINLPGITLSTTKIANPFVPIPITGKITYNQLNATFKVNEDLDNYLEIHNWMTALGSDDDFTDYATLKENQNVRNKNITNGLTSDLNLSIMTSSMNPNISVNFHDCFPIELTDLQFNSSDASLEYIEASVSFVYLRYKITQL